MIGFINHLMIKLILCGLWLALSQQLVQEIYQMRLHKVTFNFKSQTHLLSLWNDSELQLIFCLRMASAFSKLQFACLRVHPNNKYCLEYNMNLSEKCNKKKKNRFFCKFVNYQADFSNHTMKRIIKCLLEINFTKILREQLSVRSQNAT